jgi:hypothetical protein
LAWGRFGKIAASLSILFQDDADAQSFYLKTKQAIKKAQARTGKMLMTRTSIFDWTIYQNLFSAPEMEAVFDEAGTIASWVEVERAVARAQAKIGIAPNAFAKEIDNKLRAEKIDLQRLQASTKKIGRPIVGLIEQLKEQVDSEAA